MRVIVTEKGQELRKEMFFDHLNDQGSLPPEDSVKKTNPPVLVLNSPR